MIVTPALYEQIKNLPDLAALISRLQADLAAEKEKRQAFYDLVHEDCKAEFINGEIVMHSPTMMRHWRVSTLLTTALSAHVTEHKLGIIGVEKVMIRLTRNDYEPDILFFNAEKAESFHSKQLLFPAPDFVVEILSDTTKNNDYGIKMIDYALHGIPEYWIIDPEKETVEQYLLADSTYILHRKLDRESKIKSFAVKDFSMNLADLFA